MSKTTNTLSGVIFDQSTIFPHRSKVSLIGELRALLNQLKNSGLKIGVFSTNYINLDANLRAYNYPAVDQLLTKADVGENKGNKIWINTIAQRLATTCFHLLYVGDEKKEWTTAINTATFYAHAKWDEKPLPDKVTAFVCDTPAELWRFITHYLLNPPRWVHKLDSTQQNVFLRSLVGGSFQLPASSPPLFNAKDIFIHGRDIQVGEHPAEKVFMNHIITSLYLEGLIEMGTWFVLYPGHERGKVSAVSQKYFRPFSKLFHGYYKEDLLLRVKDAPDTSLLKLEKKETPFSYQTDTVCLNPDYAGKIEGRSIIVFDDFTTSGKSLEWARNLFICGGASRVILVTAGKFTRSHTVYSPASIDTIKPFSLTSYAPKQFTTLSLSVEYHPDSETLLRDSFQHIINKSPMPISPAGH